MPTQENSTLFSVRNIAKTPLLEEVNDDSVFTKTSLTLEENTENSPFKAAQFSLEANNRLPHQHEATDYFPIKKLEPTTQRNSSFLKILRIGKGKFMELPRISQVAMGAFAMVLLAGMLFWQGGDFFLADSTLTNKKSPILFDGAVYPFAKTPSWFATGGKNTRLYSEYKESELVPAPKYDLSVMVKEDWEKNIVNTKITYPIVYMGKYEYDHIENSGSHPAVDIKLPTGTPVFSMANGLVVKSEDLSSGFGKHIVVRHDGVPGYETLYSSYSHLSKRNVKVGETVTRGQQIAEVGDSGNATTAHIHFQIDIASAPFHPYWPFTTAEANAQKVSFFEAVNIGLGKEKGKQYTIHPFDFIHANIVGSRLPTEVSSSDGFKSAPSTPIPTEKSTPKPTAKPIIKETSNPETPIPVVSSEKEILSGYSLQISPSKILAGDTVYVTLYAKNQKGKWCSSCADSGTITYFENGTKKSRSYTLNNGVSEQSFVLPNIGTTTFVAKGKSFSAEGSVVVQARPQVVSVAKATPKPIVVASSSSKSSSKFKDISASHPNATAISALQKKNVISGYSDGTFRPNASVNRTEALKMIFTTFKVGTNRAVTNPFGDVPSSSWFAPYVLTAYDLDLVQGYSDGSFRPEKTMTRAEFFKIAAKTLRIDTSRLPAKNPFSDVEKNTWVAPYAQWAKENRLLDFGLEFAPNKAMTRAEMAEALYRIGNM